MLSYIMTCVQELIVLVLKQTLKEYIKNTTSSWLIVRLPLVSYVKVTYGSDINFRKLELINFNYIVRVIFSYYIFLLTN